MISKSSPFENISKSSPFENFGTSLFESETCVHFVPYAPWLSLFSP